MADLSKISVGGEVYNFKDEEARSALSDKVNTSDLDAAIEVKIKNLIGSGELDDAEYGLPEYWTTYLDDKIATIKSLQSASKHNSFSYIVMTDMHYPQEKAHYTGLLTKRIMDECDIKFALNLGDITCRGPIPEDFEASESEFEGFWSMMEPVKDRLLNTQGNHDGYMNNGSAYYYPIEDALDSVYRGMRTDVPIVWSDNGAGYYIDDSVNHTRYIMLNTCARPYGSTYTVYMGQYCYTQEQYEMTYKALRSMPANWKVVVASHVIPIWEVDRFGDGLKTTNIQTQFQDANQMVKMLNAYVNRESVTLSNGTDESSIWHVSLDVDFTGARGTLVAYHGGHYHVDKVWNAGSVVNTNTTLAYPTILHRCDSFNENQGSSSPIETALKAERVIGTTTEHCFDVITVNTDTRTIYCTKIGAGQDRVISMDGEPVSPTVTHTITTNLTNCTVADNSPKTVNDGESAYIELWAVDGADMQEATVTVTMGGVDITSDVWDASDVEMGFITISSVTGDIIITATATVNGATTDKNEANPASADWLTGYRLGQSGVSESTGNIVTNYIPCKKGDKIEIKNMNVVILSDESTACRCHLLDSSHNIIGLIRPYDLMNIVFINKDTSNDYAHSGNWEYSPVGYSSSTEAYEYADSIAYVRFCGHLTDGASASDVVITVTTPDA